MFQFSWFKKLDPEHDWSRDPTDEWTPQKIQNPEILRTIFIY